MLDGFGNGLKASPDGASVEMFVLMPDAGQLLHPAHRHPDQMVEIWPYRPAQFSFRSLVWVTGLLARTRGRWESDRALYSMTGAEIHPAVQGDTHALVQTVDPLHLYQLNNCRTLCACRLLTIKSWPLLSVTSQRWLLQRTHFTDMIDIHQCACGECGESWYSAALAG